MSFIVSICGPVDYVDNIISHCFVLGCSGYLVAKAAAITFVTIEC